MKNNLKVVNLQISRNKFQTIDVQTEEEFKLIEELNRDFYKFEKSEQRLHVRSISQEKLFEDYNFEIPSPDNDPMEILLIQDRNKALCVAIESLSEVLKNIFMLHTLENLTFEQISIKLQMPESTVRYKYKAAIKEMQELLKDYR